MFSGNTILKDVFDTASRVMEAPKWVSINWHNSMDKLAADVQVAPPSRPRGAPKVCGKELSPADTAMFELVASAVNYCYWYGRHNVRPCGAGSAQMYQLLTMAWEENGGVFGVKVIRDFLKMMTFYRYPLLAERRAHLFEVLYPLEGMWRSFPEEVFEEVAHCPECPKNIDGLVSKLISLYPGFAADMFLKRASLYFMLLNGRFGWFEEEMSLLPCPADYQVPKMLESCGVLTYHPALAALIEDGCIIHKHSAMEAEIRAATIIAVREIAKRSGTNPSRVDSHLFSLRNTVGTTHHLTLTTDY